MSKGQTSHQERIQMIQLKQQGQSLADIAHQMHLHHDTVRKWWRRYRDGGWDALCPQARGRPNQGTLSSFDPLVRYVALRLKREHPHWGADLILFTMRQRVSLQGKVLPSRSALAAYLQPYRSRIRGRARAVVGSPSSCQISPQVVHECWQMDFKGDEDLGACGKFAPLMIVDKLTSAPLETKLYPAGLKGVTQRHVQQTLRETFAQWGRPDFIQMDRGAIFVGSTRLEWPSTLLLWLVGLGIQPLINDAHRPTQNAQVERQNRTWQDHVAIGAQYTDQQVAQQATDEARYQRLACLPSANPLCGGRPPLIACPELLSHRQPFTLDQEATLFDFERVELYLADWHWLRSVDKVGYISLANRNIRVGRSYYRQAVRVFYDLTAHTFVAQACDDIGITLAQFTLPVVTAEYILGKQGEDLC